jgi:Kdo2-lipid IVA lauroyltransferase/acyltransferase
MRPTFKWYYILLSLPLYLVAILPPFLLYGLSDLLRLIFYRIFGYRKEVVFTNLRNSFPDKSEEWIRRTAYDFYRNLFDVTLETIQIAALPQRFYRKHLTQIGRECFEPFQSAGRPCVLVCGHLANWEWAGQALHASGIQVDVLYHPLTSKWFDWFLYHTRSRFGIKPIAMQSALREMMQRKHIPTATTFIADQSPSSEGCHWMTFLNQDTPVFLGTEKLAKKFNYPVIYGDILRVKRGYYQVRFKLITDAPNETPSFWITEEHTRLLEESIKAQPENWLWSHRRWKHKRNVSS